MAHARTFLQWGLQATIGNAMGGSNSAQIGFNIGTCVIGVIIYSIIVGQAAAACEQLSADTAAKKVPPPLPPQNTQ